MKKILIIEDEIAISRVLKAYLEKANYEATIAHNGEEGLRLFHETPPSLVLLDIMMPGKDGWEVLEEIREVSSCPVIMLSALGEVDHRLNGLNSGADDYITKPFVADEVIARVNSVLRRSAYLLEQEDVKYIGSLKMNYKAHSVSLNGITLTLTPRDLSLLIYLSQHPNQTFTREQLIENVWGIDYEGSDRAVDLAIKRIRKSLANWPSSEGEIKTIRGLGYQLSVY
ncbi:response regulator transcription factor [Bacillus tianshenii]|nr:response regulator transcription factor [Bacillus tianshenii]